VLHHNRIGLFNTRIESGNKDKDIAESADELGELPGRQAAASDGPMSAHTEQSFGK